MRPISVQLSPTIELDDLLRVTTLFFTPWLWRGNHFSLKLEEYFKKTFSKPWAVSFNSGRSALYSILRFFGIEGHDEVLLQAFTCVAVPNAVLWLKARPVFVDVEKNKYTMSSSDLKKKISRKSKAIIIQHTFGYADDLSMIKKIAKDNGLLLIEDCAHSLGNSYHNKPLGSFSDAAIFSFGRDKVVSSVFGGMATTANDQLGRKLKHYQQRLNKPSLGWIAQQLFHPLALSIVLPCYKIVLGKLLLFLWQKTGVLSYPVYPLEKTGGQPAIFPQKLADAQASLALGQLSKLKSFRRRRINHASLYWKHLQDINIILPPRTDQSLLRFPILAEDADNLVKKAKKQGIILGRWYSNIVDPMGVDLKKIGYIPGSCPNAEYLAKKVVNLPTSPVLTEREIMKVINFIGNHYA